MLRINHSPIAPSPAAPAAAALADAAPAAATIHADFDRPYLELVRLLRDAAEIEHALMVQYLYAAYSVKPRYDGVREAIVHIAVDEMHHLESVSTYLAELGCAPNLVSQDFPFAPELYPFPLELEPLNPTSLAKYVYAEAPASAIAPDADDYLGRLHGALNPGFRPNHVGSLYKVLIQKTAEVAATPPEDMPDIAQIDFAKWRAELERIKDEGELGHYDAFKAIFLGAHEGFGGARDVWSLPADDPAYPSFPLARNPSALRGHPREIGDARSRDLARLSNFHYWAVLTLLDLYFRDGIHRRNAAGQRDPDRRARSLAIRQMRQGLETLGEKLVALGVTGLPFDPYPLGARTGYDKERSKLVLIEALREAKSLSARLENPIAPTFYDEAVASVKAL